MSLVVTSDKRSIDTSYIVSGCRLKHLLKHSLQAEEQSTKPLDPRVSCADMLERFHHFIAPTLPHLLALLSHPSASFPPEGVTLLVVDSISTAFSQAYVQPTKPIEDRATGKKNDIAQWAYSRRWAVMTSLVSAIAKLAAMRKIAAVFTSQTTTKTRLGNTALLQPAMSGTVWDSNISSRILLYRDWQAGTVDELKSENIVGTPDLRFAASTKIGGVSLHGFGEVVPFTINSDGLCEVDVASVAFGAPGPVVPPQAVLKRKREEVADSASDSGDEVSADELNWVADSATLEI
ncbi:MAG: hypothetical protein Q9213_001307 [Squamulea squamosa]